jgi:hypothetical protein
MHYSVQPVYNEQISAAKASFRYNWSFDKEIYAISENDMSRYKRGFVISEFDINGLIVLFIFYSKNWELRNIPWIHMS